MPIVIDVAIALVATAWFAWFGVHSFDVLHDGVMFKAAVDVADGATLFRDTFTMYGPGTVHIQALAVALFGRTLVVLKYTTALFYGLTAPLLFRLWRPFLGGPVALAALVAWALTAPMLVWILIPWASVYALFFQALTGVLLLEAVTRRSQGMEVAAGVAAGMVFLCRQPVGIATSIALGCFLAVHAGSARRSVVLPLARFLAGHVACVAPVVLVFAARGMLHDWWLQNFVIPFAWSSLEDAGGQPAVIPNLLPVLGHEMFPDAYATFTWTLLPMLTAAAFVTAGLVVVRARRVPERAPAAQWTALFLTACLGLASWAQYVPITCIRHVYWAAAFMFGIPFAAAVLPIAALVANERRRRIAVAVAMLACFIGIFGRDIALRVGTARQRFAVPYFAAAGNDVFTGLRLTGPELALVTNVRRLAATYPDSQFIATTHFGALFLTLRPQAFRFLPYAGGQFYPSFLPDLVRFAATHDVIFVGAERAAIPPIDAKPAVVLRESPYLFVRFTPSN